MTDMISRTLPEGTILSGRYLLGAVRKSSDAGIAYTAFDRKLRIPAEVYEYYPVDCAVRQQNGGIAAKPGMETIYRDKCRRLRDKGNLCLHQPESDVYDVLSINGTLYFIHAVSSEKAADFYAYGAEDGGNPVASAAIPQKGESVPCVQPDVTEDDEKTRTVRGLFTHADPAADEPSVIDTQNEAPTAHFSAEELDAPEDSSEAKDTPPEVEKENTDENAVEIPICVAGKGSSAAPHISPEDSVAVLLRNKDAGTTKADGTASQTVDAPEEVDEEETAPSGTNLKLLLAILVGGLILLLLCCTIFLVSLSRITNGSVQSGSVLGVPLSEVADVTDAAIRVVGRTFDPNYASGMIVAETKNGNEIDVTVNGEIPTYAVPDFVGMTESGAQSLFAKTRYQNSTGFVSGNLQYTYVDTTEYPDGMVFEQSPAAGTERGGADISLKIARNSEKTDKSATVSSLVGKPYNRISDDFTCLITDRVYSDTVPDGYVVAQYPAAGEKLAGGVCYVVVSLGVEKTSVPDVTYMSLSEAENALYEKGLSFTVRYELHSEIAEGLVAIQTPAAGASANYGDTVTLSISGDGDWTAGATFRTAETTFTLSPGDQVKPEWDGISADSAITFRSSDPHTVAISDTGEVMALCSGHAVVTASYGGSTTALPFTVTYPASNVIRTESMCGEKLSLSGLTNGDAYVWCVRAGDATLTEDTLIGNTPGECVVSGESVDSTILLQITLTEAEKEKAYVKIPKKSITTEAETKKLLTNKGLTCTIETEYSQTVAKGRVTKIRYTGYSDADNYHFTEGSRVTLIVSLGKPSVTSIRIDKKPAKLTYSVGDKLNVSGMVVTATYADGTEQAISTGYTTEYDFSKAGRHTVAVAYEGRKASFAVEVVDTTAQTAAIKTLPSKTTYAPGDAIDTTGLSVEVTYGNGTKKVFHSGFTVKADLTKVGSATVQVTVEGLSVQYTVKVEEKKVRSLDLVKLPDKTDYTAGESLNTAGMQLRANYTDGSTATITSGWTTSCDLTKTGASTVTVTYGGKTVTFAVTVRAKETETAEQEVTLRSLSILTMPQKTEYTVGESFDPTGLVLLATYSDGSTKKRTDGFSASYDFRTAGPTTVLFQLDGKSVEIDVTVYAADTGLRLSAQTLSVAVGETVELTLDVSDAGENVRFTVEGADYVDITQTQNGMQITGIRPGKCVLTFTCGTDTAVCTVTVTNSASGDTTIGTLSYSTPIINQTAISFMPTLVFTNTEKTDVATSFTATIRFDPNTVSCADTGTSLSGVTASFDGVDTITITGTVTVPAEGTLTIAYILFLGTDTEAFSVTVS